MEVQIPAGSEKMHILKTSMVSRQSLNKQLFLEFKQEKVKVLKSRRREDVCVWQGKGRGCAGQDLKGEAACKRWMAPYETKDWTCFIFISQ